MGDHLSYFFTVQFHICKIVQKSMLRFDKSMRGAELCMSKLCKRGDGVDDDGDDEVPGLVVNGVVLEEVEQFCFLGDVLDCEAGV